MATTTGQGEINRRDRRRDGYDLLIINGVPGIMQRCLHDVIPLILTMVSVS